MSLQKSKTGALPVSDIYSFMMENFPYFKTAPDGWKNSVRHNLSLNKCFEKVEKPNGSQRKGCLWALNPLKTSKMEEELQKWKRKDPESIRKSMSNPEEFDREIEELRRSDEEAARKRLVGLANRGLHTSCYPTSPFPIYNPPQFHNQQPVIIGQPTTNFLQQNPNFNQQQPNYYINQNTNFQQTEVMNNDHQFFDQNQIDPIFQEPMMSWNNDEAMMSLPSSSDATRTVVRGNTLPSLTLPKLNTKLAVSNEQAVSQSVAFNSSTNKSVMLH